MLRAIARRLPAWIRGPVGRVYRACPGRGLVASEPWNETTFNPSSRSGPLVTEVFNKIRPIPGWFNIDDCAHFYLVLTMQSRLGVRGDLLEIGTYHGRSACLLAYCLEDGERLVVCDAFDAPTPEPGYADPPSPASLMRNIQRVNPGLDPGRVTVHACLSGDLRLDAAERLRFVHVDGGHDEAVVRADLDLADRHLAPGGVIVIDDYQHRGYPGVTAAADGFIDAHSGRYRVLADLNRHGALGRKLYLIRAGEGDAAGV